MVLTVTFGEENAQRYRASAFREGDVVTGAHEAERTFNRVSLAQAGNLPRALTCVGVHSHGRMTEEILTGRFRLHGRVWQNPDGSIGENDTTRPDLPTVRWYTIDKTGGLALREEWAIYRHRVVYRREEYTVLPKTAGAISAPNALRGYREVPVHQEPHLPRYAKRLVTPPAQELYQKWCFASDRLRTLAFDAQVVQSAPRTPKGGNFSGEFRLWLYKPNQTRVEYRTLSGKTRGEQTWVAVADGVQVTCLKTTHFNVAGEFWNGLTRAGLQDPSDTVRWVFEGPDALEEWESVAHGGACIAPDGTSLHALEFTRTEQKSSGGRVQTITTRMRVGLADDGLPRLIETVRQTHIAGLPERDQPAVTTIRRYYQNVKVDHAPSLNRFAF